jgi:phosphate transport system substrate-binding protein
MYNPRRFPMNRIVTAAVTIAVIAIAFISPSFAQQIELIGAGATFPYPLYSKVFDVYSKEYGTKVNYQAIGSGGGIRQLINKTVDFGGSDAVIGEEEAKTVGATILHIPICAGAVVVTYNLPGNPDIKLTGDLVASIFEGKITKWNDPKIAAENQGANLPNLPITVVHRSDGSGTTFIFSDYLARFSADWASKVGKGTSLNWPAGLGAKGNPGVAGLVKQTPGSVGYVELIYALQNKMSFASIKNQKGKFMKPTLASTSAAMDIDLPPHMMVSLTNTDAPEGYPVAGFTWVLLYKEQAYEARSEAKAKELVKLVWWMTHEGQKYAEPMSYAPLSKKAVQKAEGLIKSVTFNGKAIMK